MEKSKKIVSLILTICALTALCAVGASASTPTRDYSTGRFQSDRYYIFEQSNSLPLPYYDQIINGNTLGFSARGDFTPFINFSVSFILTWSHDDLANLRLYLDSLTVIYSYTDPYLSNEFSSCSLISVQTETVSNGYLVTCLYSSSVVFNSTDVGIYDSGFYYFKLPQNSSLSPYYSMRTLTAISITPSDPPEPPPDPSDPSSGSSEGALLDGFTWAQNIGYYASFSPLLNSSTLDPSYLGVTRMSRLPYDQITDSKFQAPSSSNGCALIMGQKTDYSDILVSGTVGYGVCAALVTSPFKLDSSTLGVDYSAQIFFASGDDPSSSGYTQVDVSTLGLEEYTVRVWSIDYNEWSKIVMCRFYFVLDLGVSTPSFPTDTISVQFKSTSVHTHEWYWTPFDFRFQYALRDSESDPLPDSVTNYNPATGSPTSNGGYNTSGSTVSSDLNEELTWANDALVKLNPMQESVLNAVKYFYDDDGQLFQDITGSLESLYNSLSYTGVGGTLKFPRAVIPWGDGTLMLWSEKTIPFSDYINQIPTIYVTIISFLLVTGGWFAFIAISVKFFKRTFYGDVTSERF